MSYALDARDAGLYEEAAAAVRPLLPEGAAGRERLQEMENKLDALKRENRQSGAALVKDAPTS
jgi:hypothetical protein